RLLGHVREQQLEHELLRLAHPFVVGRHLHAGGRRATARRREHPLAADLDNAGAAVADLVEARLVAQARERDAFGVGALDQRRAVHWPHDSYSKNFIRLRAAPIALSWSDSTITAAEPMKQPYGCRVSKSSGIQSIVAGRMPPDAPPGR